MQGTGGYCNENADCRSNNCAKMVTTGSVRIGTCAAAVLSGSNTLSSKLRLPLTGRVTIPLSNLRIPANTAPSGTLITTQGKGVNVACTAASECTSKICGRATTSASKVCKATCSLASDCETGKRCSAGRCITPASPRTEGQSCSANLPCATGLACTNGVCEVPAAAGDSADSNANALSNADTSVGSCQAACTETCRLECTPSAGTKAIGEVCSSPTGCRTECETGYGECSCEGAAIAKKPEGESCNDNEECEAGLECTSNRLFGNKCTKVEAGSKEIGDECSADNDCKSEYCQLRNTGRVMAASGPNAVCAERLATNLEIGEQCYIHTQCKSTYCERPPITESGVTEPGVCTQLAPLTPEVQRQVRTNLDALEPKLERLEQQVVADRLVASREALIALSARLDCYVTINDIELKAECFKIRFETVTNLLESRGQITADKAREWKSKVGGQGQAVAQERRAEVKASPPPAKTFTQRVKDVFRITGSFWRVTGGFVVDETEVQVGTAGEELRVIEAIPTDYLNDLNTQYSQLAALETDICSKYPTTLTSASVLKSCTTNLQCGASGAVKCVSGKCRVDKAEVCTVGEFSSAAPSSTDTPPSPEGGMGDVEVILPPATCDSPIGFEIVSFCRGEESSGIAFVNISLRNTADIDINGFGLSLYKTDNSIINLPASTLPLLTARTEYLKNIRLGRFGSNFRGSSRVNPQIGTEQCNDKKQFFGIEGTLLPLCKGQPCTGSGACASGTCSAGVCQ